MRERSSEGGGKGMRQVRKDERQLSNVRCQSCYVLTQAKRKDKPQSIALREPRNSTSLVVLPRRREALLSRRVRGSRGDK